MMKRIAILILLVALLLSIPSSVLAQNSSFQLVEETVHVYWNDDGTSSLDYLFVFENDPGASPIDFVDVATPSDNYVLSSIFADVDGHPITHIQESEFIDQGIELGLGSNAIQPGQMGRVHAFIGTVRDVLYPDDDDENYVSAVFAPTRFGSEFANGNTDLTVTFHLPTGVEPNEPRWHSAPSGFPDTPQTGFDDEGRITYTWRNTSANAWTQYNFGASFPEQYVPAEAVVTPPAFSFDFNFEALIPFLCIGFFAFFIFLGIYGDRRRKMQYLPPKIAIEGHGIKRGLTAIEAAILMEQPMDKILTMILFSVIKKNVAEVETRDPLEIRVKEPLPEDLRPYETDFLAAFEEKSGAPRRKALQKMMVNLVKGVSNKMKGFSRRETLAYYQDIMKRAWAQVEAADTPEVKSQKFDEVMEWTMLDREYDDRTREVFRGGPVFVPVWWPRYDPGFGRSSGAPVSTARPSSAPSGGGSSMPNLPGSEFAASVVTGVQNFSSGVIGNVSEFTSGVTQVTNPPPKSTSSGRSRGGGGGSSCACACACAGCACACAGGGR